MNLMQKIGCMAVILVIGMPSYAQSVDFAAEPVELVTQVSNVLFDNINKNRRTYEQDPGQMQTLVNDVFIPLLDKKRSARLILGKHGRGLDSEKVDAFADALLNQLVNQYAEGLLEFDSRDLVEILPLAGKNTDRQTRVRTRIELGNGEKAPVDYVLRKTDDGWKAFDVIVEGISFVATYRTQFGEEIDRDGFDQVLNRLQSDVFALN